MIQSSQPRKERRFRFNAPMHERQKFMHVQISKELKAKLGIKRRSMQLRKGDTVRVTSGKQRGKAGKVSLVNLRTGRVLIDGITRRNGKGKELQIPIYSSNLIITEMDLSDKFRSKKAGVAKEKVAAQKAAPKAPAPKAAAPKAPAPEVAVAQAAVAATQ